MNYRRLPIFLCLLLMTAACLVAVSSSPTQAGTTRPSWLDKTIEAKEQKDLSPDEFNQRRSGRSCQQVKTEEWKPTPAWVWIPNKTKVNDDVCMVAGATGYFGVDNTSKFIVAYGSPLVQRLYGFNNDDFRNAYMQQITNTNRIVYVTNLGYLQYQAELHITNNWNDTFPVSSQPNWLGNVERHQVKGFDYTLHDEQGAIKGVTIESMVSSANGDWLHVLIPGKTYLLLNTLTYKTIPYAAGNYPSYAVYAAVSNDGRFVARTTELFSLKIFDTVRCQADQGALVSRNCESKELLGDPGQDTVLRKAFPDKNINVGRVNFVGNGNALDVDLDVSDGVSHSYYTYRVKLSGSEPTKYLALGDSFSSGEGAFDYVESTDRFVSNDEYNVCHISRKSYPYILQQNLQADWFYSVACSGSESKDVVYAKTLDDYVIRGNPRAKFQLQGEDDVEKSAFILQESSFYINNLRPGYVPQYTFVSKDNPNVATISLGGNDVGFAGIIASCIFKGVNINQTCFSGRDERESKANEIDQKISTWSKNFVDIKNSLGGSDPKLYVIGYPKIVDTDLRNRCGLNVPFDDAERLLTDRLVDYLNAAVKVAADAAGVRYVDASDALTRTGEHRLCGSGPEFAVNGLDLRSYVNECASAVAPGAPACPNSFHPNELGQKLLAETILTRTTNLTQSMSDNSNSTANLIDKRMDFVGDVSITLQNHRITFWKDIAPELIAKGGTFHINIPKFENDLPAQPGFSATVTAHSTPLTLGQLPIAADGTITGDVVLPTDIETGYHRLIVSYTDIAGNIVEKYKYFFAAHSMTDWDGDGIDNASDPCSIAIQSNIDIDKDGVDDACDGEYVKAVQTSTPIQNPGTIDGQPVTITAPQSKANDTTDDVSLGGLDGDQLDDIFTNPAATVPLHSLQLPTSDSSVQQATGSDTGAANLLLPLSVIAGLFLLMLAPFFLRKHRM